MKTVCPNIQKPTGQQAGGSKPGGWNQNNRGGGYKGNNARNGGKPYGKLNCTNVEEVNNSNQAVIGTLHILTYPGKVLFDTGATTSFISKEFVDTYGIRCNVLDHPVKILSAGGTVIVTQAKIDQVIMIYRNIYFADLLVIAMKEIAVILGMDWLTDNRAQIDCTEKTVSLRSLDGGRIVYQG